MMNKKLVPVIVAAMIIFGSAAVAIAYNDSPGNPQESEGAYAPYSGPKKRIAVTRFDNKVRGAWGGWNVGDGMAEMLTTELMKTNRFVVVERQALRDVLGEQELGQAGVIRRETAAKVGQVLGAQIIVRGVVSEFEQNESGGGGGIGIHGFSLGVRGSNAHVAVDIRLIDSSTGQVLFSHNAVGKAESSGVGFGVAVGHVDFGAESFRNAPIGQATRQAISDAIRFIISKMETVPFSAKVVKMDGNNVYINIGSFMNVRPGMKLYAYSLGEDLVDPDTGLKLGADEKMIGTVEIRDVQEKYSIGQIISGQGQLKRGDLLKMQ